MRRTLVVAMTAFLALMALQPCASGGLAADAEISVSGLVSDAGGSPMAGVQVMAISVANGSVRSSLTNSSGMYSISLPAGTYNISASYARHSANITYYFLQANADLEGLDFTMSLLPGAVTGFITTGDMALAGAMVTLSGDGVNYSAESTAPFGRFEISGVRPGYYLAKAERPGYWTAYAPAPVPVLAGESVNVNFTLSAQPARVYGMVTLGGSGEAGVTVHLLSAGSLVTETLTNELGNFSLANIPSGEYTLTFSKEGLEDEAVQISLLPFADQRVDVAMVRQPVQGGEGFIAGLDLTHSMMVVGLIVSLLLMLFALFIKLRSSSHPGLLAKEESEENKEK